MTVFVTRDIIWEEFSLETLYDMIHVLAVWEQLKLIYEGGLKGESETKASTRYIRVIKNRIIEWFALQLGTRGDHFVIQNQLLVRKKVVHKNISSYIYDEYIHSAIMEWLKS